ncbi:putative iron-regulated membrane protein [Hymenobacter luteus]|uniref:Iron-regulated membrane protein n=2 Tax=Hymenobacter TaxID=89966 RepID=A0ABR6JXN3_9BACT|nr:MULTISPECIES: PepSY-associated TM helix domain-containing protein [Hymenobacter]MBB4601568.1 putative iron-regulated membrane protein [Hymenobacter latericoloratus]MBB6060004.1 putative iron-regulated membrane protein [Hymenobacter luteus]
MTAKQLVGKLHLWLGLASGLVVFIVSITGAIFVFQDEIRDLTEPWRKVEARAMAPVLPSRLQAAALAAHPDVASQDTWVTYFGPARSATVFFTTKAGAPTQVYLNPYTAEVLHEHDLRTHFFAVVQEIHMTLLLPEAIAKWVVGGAVLIFVVMLITGLVLWWPKRKQERKQRFTIKWGARWRRVNYDLHNVLGFYAASMGLLLALTGLFMIFPSVLTPIAYVANGGKTYPQDLITAKVDTLQPVAAAALPVRDVIYQAARRRSPQAEMILLGPTGTGKQPAYCWTYRQALHYYYRDDYAFHPVSGQELQASLHDTKSAGTRLTDMNYDIHTGQILGLGGKTVAFLASLVSASLPVTGTIIWWGRRNKKKKPRKRQVQVA